MKNDAVRKKTVEAGVLYRAATLGTIDEEARTVELAFSSEIAVDRYFGAEILDHSNKSVVLDWLNTGRAPLLADHDPSIQIGVIERAEISKDRVGRAVVRFGKGAQSDAYFQDVKDGIRANISVGYRIHQMILEEEGESGAVYRVTKWEPLEISLVSIPADQSVGIGRSAEEKRAIEIIIPNHTPTENKPMTTEPNAAIAATPAVNEAALRAAYQKENEVRTNELMALGKRHNMIEKAAEYIATGKSVDEFRGFVLDNIGTTKAIDSARTDSTIGLTDKEVKRYSMLRALNALANPTDLSAQQAAAFEREVSNAAAVKRGKPAQGFVVPIDVLKRDLLVGTATAGGHTVRTDLASANFIDLLRAAMVLDKMGVTMLGDLIGNLAIPRQTSGSTGYWVAENGSVTESQPAFDQVAMAPKTVGGLVEVSRKLLLQSSIDVENFVTKDLATTLGQMIQQAAIAGTGASNQPTGILNTAGIGSVAGGTNGAVVTWANIVDLESAVANVNADIGKMQYLTNTKQRGVLKKTLKTSPSTEFMWRGGATPVNEYGCAITNDVPSNLVKGASGAVCSGIIFGNFEDLIIGMWGGIDILVDPYTTSATGAVRFRALQDVDVAVRHPESFAAMKDAL